MRRQLGTPSLRHAALFALLPLLLMPVNYRAGATAPHPHALIQLMHEALAGLPVHQHGPEQDGDHAHPSGDVAKPQAGTSATHLFAPSALLPMIVLVLALRPRQASVLPVSDSSLAGCRPAPAHPPPQLRPAPVAIP